MAGIARENVSRILNDWKRRKLVSRLSGYYCIENKAQLQTDFARISQKYLNAIALRLNQRPRKTLGFQTPADKLQAVLH